MDSRIEEFRKAVKAYLFALENVNVPPPPLLVMFGFRTMTWSDVDEAWQKMKSAEQELIKLHEERKNHA